MNYHLLTFPLLASMPGLVAIAMGCIMPICIVIATYVFRHQKSKLAHETLRTMIEKGQAVTPETIAALKLEGNDPIGSPERSARDLRTGVMLATIGAGLVIFMGRPGWVVLLVGVTFLILSLTGRKPPPKQEPGRIDVPPQ